MLRTVFVASTIIAILAGFATVYFAKSGHDRKALVPLILAVVFGVTALLCHIKINRNQADNDAAAGQSGPLQAMMETLTWHRADLMYQVGRDWTLAYTPREDLRAGEPYAVVQIRPEGRPARAVFDRFILYSGGDTVTAADLAACKTIVFCVSSWWDQATYSTSYYHNFSGDTERKRLYLYDPAAGVIFAEGELKASPLPKSADQEPHYTVSETTIRQWVDRQIRAGEGD